MKRVPFVLLAFIAMGPLFAQDDSGSTSQEVLQNSTFSDGTTYWHGDCKPASSDMTTDFTSNTPGPGGILVELHSSNWTSVTQELRDKAAPAYALLTITYQVSSDFKLSDRASDYGNCGPSAGFGGANIPSRPGKIVAFIDVPPLSRTSVANSGGGGAMITVYNDNATYVNLAPVTDQSPQTFTVRMHPPPPTPDSHQTLCLAFPPGSGSVTITKISLTPGQVGALPNP